MSGAFLPGCGCLRRSEAGAVGGGRQGLGCEGGGEDCLAGGTGGGVGLGVVMAVVATGGVHTPDC